VRKPIGGHTAYPQKRELRLASNRFLWNKKKRKSCRSDFFLPWSIDTGMQGNPFHHEEDFINLPASKEMHEAGVLPRQRYRRKFIADYSSQTA
jgi:hypothetical protein